MPMSPDEFIGTTTFGSLNDSSRSEADRYRRLARLTERLTPIAHGLLGTTHVLRRDLDTADLVQEVVQKVNRQLESSSKKFDSKTHYIAWCTRILVNFMNEKVERMLAQKRGNGEPVFSLREDDKNTLHDGAAREARANYEKARNGLEELRSTDQDVAEAFYLVVLEGKTRKEVAEIQGISQSTAWREIRAGTRFPTCQDG